MSNDIIPYNMRTGLINTGQLSDLEGTFDDLGQLISYMRDLSRSLVPLSDNINTFITTAPDKLHRFISDNKLLFLSGMAGGALIGGYLLSSIFINILDIRRHLLSNK